MKRPLTWIPWYVDSWLYGSSRLELTRAQRSDFLDLVLLSGKDDGWIRANETMAYPPGQLAGMLNIKPEDLEETIGRCIEVGKIKRFENGSLYVVGWETYKLTGRWRRELEKRALPHSPSSKNKSKKRRGEESKGKRNTVPKKRNSVPEKRNSPPPGSQNQEEEVDKDGLLPIPKGLSFKAQDELKELRAEIRKDLRDLASGKRKDWVTREGVEKKIAEFNQRVKDLS